MRSESSSAWVAFGESAKYEDCLIGNREGLEVLRSKIDEVLERGAASLPAQITGATRILLIDESSNPEWLPEKHRRVKNAIGFTGCAIIAVALFVIFVIGVGTLRDWWK